VRFGIRYSQDELITAHYPYFREDSKFIEALNFNFSFDLSPRSAIEHDWRVHVLCSLAFNAIKGGDGDLIECGVFRGDCAKTIMHYCDLNSSNKVFWLLDSFDGFDRTQLTKKEQELRTEKQFRGVLEFVTEKFRGDKCARIVPGFVPTTFERVTAKSFCFAHIDMNASYPEKEALGFIFPRLKEGGVIVFDDYGHAGHEEQRVELDNMAKKLGRSITCLPTGQGLLIK
jgi:O-methyltransferase